MTTATDSPSVFKARGVERVRQALRRRDEPLLRALGADLGEALRGSDDATRAYVRGYRRLAVDLLSDARAAEPDLVLIDENGVAAIVDVKGRPAQAPVEALENRAVEAPFSVWAASYGLGDAVGLDLTSRIRVLLGHSALTPPKSGGRSSHALDDLAARRFIRRARHYLNHPAADDPLGRIMTAFQLSKTELGTLFGVRRQAIDQWRERGVPAERQEKVATLEALVDLLERKLKSGRLPGVARRPADAYGGETMLDLIRQGKHGELLEVVRRSFDWADAA